MGFPVAGLSRVAFVASLDGVGDGAAVRPAETEGVTPFGEHRGERHEFGVFGAG